MPSCCIDILQKQLEDLYVGKKIKGCYKRGEGYKYEEVKSIKIINDYGLTIYFVNEDGGFFESIFIESPLPDICDDLTND